MTQAGLVGCPASPGTVAPSGSGGGYQDLFTVDHLGRITNFDGMTRAHGAPVSGCNAGTPAVKPHAMTSSTGGGITSTFAYNCNGAVVSETVTGGPSPGATSYAWDSQQRLASTTTTAGTAVNVYDTTNNRIGRIDADGTRTVYAGPTEIRYQAATGVQVARNYSANTRREFSGAVVNYAVNAQGTPAAGTSSAGGAPYRLRTDPYGEARAVPNGQTAIDDRNFLNQPVDPDGTAYLTNRHYDSVAGNFLSVDPIVATLRPAALNPYTYGLARPVAMDDRSGLQARMEVDGGAGGHLGAGGGPRGMFVVDDLAVTPQPGSTNWGSKRPPSWKYRDDILAASEKWGVSWNLVAGILDWEARSANNATTMLTLGVIRNRFWDIPIDFAKAMIRPSTTTLGVAQLRRGRVQEVLDSHPEFALEMAYLLWDPTEVAGEPGFEMSADLNPLLAGDLWSFSQTDNRLSILLAAGHLHDIESEVRSHLTESGYVILPPGSAGQSTRGIPLSQIVATGYNAGVADALAPFTPNGFDSARVSNRFDSYGGLVTQRMSDR